MCVFFLAVVLTVEQVHWCWFDFMLLSDCISQSRIFFFGDQNDFTSHGAVKLVL